MQIWASADFIPVKGQNFPGEGAGGTKATLAPLPDTH
jgi:hypothetical protein